MGRILWAWCFAWLLVLSPVRGAWAQTFGPIHVCVRPPKVAAAGVGVWAYAAGGVTIVTANPQFFQQKSSGLTVYVFDPNAPPESAKLLPIPHNKLTCPPRVLPMKPPAPPASAAPPPPPLPAARAPKKDGPPGPSVSHPAGAPKKDGAPDPQPKPITYPSPPPQEHHPGQPTGGSLPPTVLPIARPTAKGDHGMLPMTTVLPVVRGSKRPGSGQGSGNGNPSSDAPIKVAKKDALDKLAEELGYAGAIANQQLNEDTKRPDGKQYGIPGGKNPNGPNHPVAQAAAGAVLVVAGVVSAGNFEKKLMDAIKKKTPLLITEKMLTKEVAEEIAAKYGAHAADALAKNGAIGPYSLMRKFTEKLGGRWQAHHILEEQMMKRFKLGNPDLAPSVILTEAEHKAMTAKLRAKTAGADSVEELWKAYKEAYETHPDWLKVIESYFSSGK